MEEKKFLGDRPAICGRYISFLYRKSSVYFVSQFKNINLSAMQSILLVGIYRHEGLNQKTLADIIAIDPGATSRVLRELEDQHYIVKRRDEKNRRSHNLFLTPSGQKLAEQSLIIQGEYWDMLLQSFTPEEAKTLNSLLQRMEIESRILGEIVV